MRVRPSDPHTGICFIRNDQSPPARIAALVENVSKRSRRTSLRNGSVAIETVEHCLSACVGLGLDNLQIELNGNEVPAMDGSSLPFVTALRDGGVCQQDALRDPYVVADTVRVVEGDSELIALPPLDPTSDLLEVSYDLDYGEQGRKAVAELLRVHQQQNIYILRDRAGVGFDCLHLEELLHLKTLAEVLPPVGAPQRQCIHDLD